MVKASAAGRSGDVPHIDTHELTRLGRQVQGQTPLHQFARFSDGLPSQGNAVATWSVTGLCDTLGQGFLDVSVQAMPVVSCQRCMGDLSVDVVSASRLKVVSTEAELDVVDDLDASPDDWIEPVLASSHLDVLALIEDELILGVPYVPVHEHCSPKELNKGKLSDEETELDEPSPFAVLRQLKKD